LASGCWSYHFPLPARGATVVAIGASNTFGKGVARGQTFPAQLEALLRARGYNVKVVNAGINGETTEEMLVRLDRTVPKGASVVILQPGGNDRRKGIGYQRSANISAIESRVAARGARVVLVENNMFRGLPHQSDGIHLTPEGYRMLANSILPDVAAALARK
jgi:acyl-CoA thioesterase-1